MTISICIMGKDPTSATRVVKALWGDLLFFAIIKFTVEETPVNAECEKVFSWKSHLVWHQKIHNGKNSLTMTWNRFQSEPRFCGLSNSSLHLKWSSLLSLLFLFPDSSDAIYSGSLLERPDGLAGLHAPQQCFPCSVGIIDLFNHLFHFSEFLEGNTFWRLWNSQCLEHTRYWTNA